MKGLNNTKDSRFIFSKMAFACLFGCFFILGSCPCIRSCLQCDPVVRYVHEDFLSSVKGITVRDQIELKQIIEQAYINYRETSTSFRGVIGNVRPTAVIAL